jgi:hypothetical protein
MQLVIMESQLTAKKTMIAMTGVIAHLQSLIVRLQSLRIRTTNLELEKLQILLILITKIIYLRLKLTII